MAELLMAKLPRVHRHWVLINALALTALMNLLVNGGIAWLSTIGIAGVPLMAAPILGGPSTITDTLGTLVLLPLITNLLVTSAVHHDRRAGRLPPLCDDPLSGPILRLPHTRTARGLTLAAGCTALLGPPTVLLLLMVFGLTDISRAVFILYKASLESPSARSSHP